MPKLRAERQQPYWEVPETEILGIKKAAGGAVQWTAMPVAAPSTSLADPSPGDSSKLALPANVAGVKTLKVTTAGGTAGTIKFMTPNGDTIGTTGGTLAASWVADRLFTRIIASVTNTTGTPTKVSITANSMPDMRNRKLRGAR